MAEVRARAQASFRAPTYGLRQVLHAANASRATVRNWLTEKRFALTAEQDRSEGEHRLFSQRDVLVLALATRFHEFGIPVTIFPHIGEPIIAEIEREIGEILMSAGGRRRVQISRDRGEWRVEPLVDRKPAPSAVGIVVDIDQLVDETMERLLGMKR